MPIVPSREEMWAEYQLHRMRNFGRVVGVEPVFRSQYDRRTLYYLADTHVSAATLAQPVLLAEEMRKALDEFCSSLDKSDQKYVTVWDSLGNMQEGETA